MTVLKRFVILSVLIASNFNTVNANKIDGFTEVYCPDETICLDGPLSISGYIPWWDLSPPHPVSHCGGIQIFQLNLEFEAYSSELEFTVSWSHPGDLKAGIVDGCNTSADCIVFQNCSSSQEFTVYTDDLIVGHTYILYVDPCANFVDAPFDIEIEPGAQEDMTSIEDIYLFIDDNCENELSEDEFCMNRELSIGLIGENENETEYLRNINAEWEFTITGENNQEVVLLNLETDKLSFETPGNYNLVLDKLKLDCQEFDYDISYEFEIKSLDQSFGPDLVCSSDLFNWNRMGDWLGEYINEAGYYIEEHLDDCGCPFSQEIIVEEYLELTEVVTIELCPDDYPYFYYDDYEIDYSSFDQEFMISFHEGSVVEDYDRENCDSLVHLIVINENPEERCSSCELPVSLEKSKIIYCVPFDNGTFDVSGKANRIYPVGVGYDNNGPANNPLWEAEFDGRDDHVWIPHIDDLNTSVFAFDLEFKKEGVFENSEPEVLISKGDLSEANRRFDITLEERTETSFDMIASFYTESDELSIIVPELMIGEWYGTTVVVEEDSVSLYMNGILHETILKVEDLRGNDLNMYLATSEEGGNLTNFFDGRMDDFKYWKQKLSGQDVLYLYYPEKEFEVNIDMFLNCCETGSFRDIVIDQDNPKDTLIIEEASSTGYDSVYFIQMIPIDDGPAIDDMLVPEDIVVQRSVTCNESCSQLIEWEEPPMEIFSDLCGITMIESSHQSPVLLDESVSFVEIIHTATNECGNTSSYSFSLELQCESEDFELLPRDNDFDVMDELGCSSQENYCIGNNLRMELYNMESPIIDLEQYDGLKYVLSVNGEEHEVLVSEQEDFSYDLSLEAAGNYTLCYESLESECDKVEVNICKQIKLREGTVIDHGSVIACRGSLEEVLPQGIGEELMNSLMDPNTEGHIETSSEDACSCLITESIDVQYREQIAEEHVYDVCRDDLPVVILGEEFADEVLYDQSMIVFEGMSDQLDSNGNNCDSTIVLTINIHEDAFTEMEIEICEGEEYNGYNSPGTYMEHYETLKSCDSTHTIHVYVLEAVEEEITAEICEGEILFGYVQSGSYVDSFVAMNGCDSIRHLELQVLESSIEELSIEICPDEVYNGYTETGIYEEIYINAVGCDSTVLIQLTVLDEEHEDCIMSSISEETIDNIRLYPNPVRDILHIDFGESQGRAVDYSIFNINGSMFMKNILNDKKEIDITNLAEGIYILMLKTKEHYSVHRIIKQ